MAEFKLGAGITLDLLTKGELDDSLRSRADAEWIERARGVKYIGPMAGSAGTIGTSVAYAIPGPRSGYAWALRLLGVNCSAAASVTAWITSDNAATVPAGGPVGTTASGTYGVITWSGVQAVLKQGTYLTLAASASASVSYTLSAIEVPEELLWKVA